MPLRPSFNRNRPVFSYSLSVWDTSISQTPRGPGPSCLKVSQTTVVTCGYMHDSLYAAAAIPVTQGSDLSVIPGVRTVIKSLISY